MNVYIYTVFKVYPNGKEDELESYATKEEASARAEKVRRRYINSGVKVIVKKLKVVCP